MARPSITLAGARAIAVGVQGWRFTAGVKPNRQIFNVHDSAWSTIEGKMGQEVTLKIGQRSIERLVLVEEVPTAKPHHRAVMVCDRRYWWERKLVLRNYNIRRRQSAKRLVGPELQQLQTPVAEYGFFPASIDTEEGEPWHARSYIEDVLEAIEPDNWEIDSIPTVSTKIVIEETGEDVRGRVTLNDERLRDPGDRALGRALASAPGAMVWVDAKGKARVFDSTDLNVTEDLLAGVGPETTSGGIMRKIARAKIRPKEVHVYFEREIEMLARSLEEGQPESASAAPDEKEGTRAELWNVAPLPDPTLQNVETGTELVMSTWVRFDHLVPSWEADRQANSDDNLVLPFTFDNIRRNFLKGGLHAIWGGHGDLLASGSGPRRVGTIYSHWRSSYQLDPLIMDRMERIAAVRLAVLDDVTRTRAIASVWATYAVEMSAKGVYLAKWRQDPLTSTFLNNNAYPDVDNGEVWDEIEGVASAVLTMRDAELGIFGIQWKTDDTGQLAAVFPGYLVGEHDEDHSPEGPLDQVAVMPATTVYRALRFQNDEPIILGGTVGDAPGVMLSGRFRTMFIFSGVQGAPNSKARFDKVVVKPDDVLDELRQEFNVQDSDGPVWEVFAPPSLVTSRWGLIPAKFNMDEYLEALNLLLGITEAEEDDEDADEAAQDGAEEAQALEPAPDPWEILNAGHVRAWAAAEAIKVWAGLADRVEGQPAFHMSTLPSEIKLGGSLRGMSLEAEASGRLVGRASLSGVEFNLNPVALLPQWARPQLLGAVLDEAKP